MDADRLRYLERKYWAGETTLGEEQELRQLVLTEKFAVSEPLKSLVQAEEVLKSESLDTTFDETFWAKVRDSKTTSSPPALRLAHFFKYAAVGVILFGIALGLWSIVSNSIVSKDSVADTMLVDTYSDPKQAYYEVQKALLFASKNLNRGAQPLGEIKRFHAAEVSIMGAGSSSSHTNSKIYENNETQE